MKKNGNKKKRHKRAAVAPGLQIRTTIDFGEEGVPLEKFGEIMRTLRQRHSDIASKATTGFVPIPFDRYVDLHGQNNPSVDRNEFASRLREAVEARKAGARCACGALIWAIGSAEVGAACFTCIIGEGIVKLRRQLAELANEQPHSQLPRVPIPTRDYQSRGVALPSLLLELSRY